MNKLVYRYSHGRRMDHPSTETTEVREFRYMDALDAADDVLRQVARVNRGDVVPAKERRVQS